MNLVLLLLLQMGDLSKVEVKTHKVGGSVYMLEGAGGNIGVSAGDDGVFIIDDEFKELAPKIKAALAAISKKPLRYIFNTHWHGDHTGANEPMAAGGAVIVAHDNVRKRLSTEQVVEMMKMKIPPAPARALPVITFGQDVTFYLNGDEVHVFHVEHAHTDGDAIIHFKKANIIHTGDVFINGFYPVIDFSTGGTVDGYLAAQEKLLSMIDENTKLIPGHGPIGDKAALKEAHDVLKSARDAIAKLAKRMTLEQVIAAKPTAQWDAKYANAFVTPQLFVTMVYNTLPKKGRTK